MKTITGIEVLETNPPEYLRGKRLGLLANPASVNRHLLHSRMIIDRLFPNQLTALFSPQHGFFAEKQDNMIESSHGTDPVLKIPIFSLYGETREPTRTMFDRIDTLIVDLQDVGTRVYTFIYTMALCMRAAKSFGKEIVVLDRPNPIGGLITEGNCLRNEYASFVGMYAVPMRHGLTIGELASLFNDHFSINCRLTVIPMVGWKRDMLFRHTGLPWIAPSPNLPTPVSAMVYPGQVLWEGTNVSEGRGTTQPFELFGAPFLDVLKIEKSLNKKAKAGIQLRPAAFEPTSNKWAGRLCFGFQIHVLRPQFYRPYRTTLALIAAVMRYHGDVFEWKSPPYEYEYEKKPFDLITGDPAIRQAIENQDPLEDLEDRWREALERFEKVRTSYFLY